MPSYITPNRFRTMALGVDLSNKTNAELASVIAGASTEANRFCAVNRDHDFRGGTVEEEEHLWDVGNSYRRPSGRLWPFHRPIKDVSKVAIYVTKQQHIDYTGTMLFWNRKLNYIEPIAAPITTALITSIPPWLLSSPVAYIDYTYGWDMVEKKEYLYPDGSKTYRAVNQFWTDDPVKVYVNGEEVVTGFTINYHEGTITFDSLQEESAEIAVDYVHTLPLEIALATGIICCDLMGYANINASGLTGLSGIKVEEIELRQSAKSGFNVYSMHPAAALLLSGYVELSIA